MRKPIRFYAITLVVVLLTTTIFSAGCSCLPHSDMPYGPKVTSDSAGGAIAVYEDIRSSDERDFYAQKIDPSGKVLWGERGMLIGSGYKQFDSFHDLKIVSDASGGAIMTWTTRPSSQGAYIHHVTRVDSEGNIL